MAVTHTIENRPELMGENPTDFGIRVPLEASSTFKPGLVQISAAGEAEAVAAGASTLNLTWANSRGDQSANEFTSQYDDFITVYPVKNRVIRLHASGTINETDIDVDYGITLAGANSDIPCLDKSDTTNTALKLLGIAVGSYGDTNPIVYARVIDSQVFY